MGRPKKDAIASPPPAPSPETVRTQVKMMSGHASEEEMAESLPENTMTVPAEELTPTGRKKRVLGPRKPKEAPSSDPLMEDKVYVAALKDMQGFGGASVVKGGFDVAAVAMKDESMALQTEEEKRLDGYFYVMSKKYNVLDPTNHWFTMALYFFGMLGSFIFARVAKRKGNSLVAQFTKWFGGEEKEEPSEDTAHTE